VPHYTILVTVTCIKMTHLGHLQWMFCKPGVGRGKGKDKGRKNERSYLQTREDVPWLSPILPSQRAKGQERHLCLSLFLSFFGFFFSAYRITSFIITFSDPYSKAFLSCLFFIPYFFVCPLPPPPPPKSVIVFWGHGSFLPFLSSFLAFLGHNLNWR